MQKMLLHQEGFQGTTGPIIPKKKEKLRFEDFLNFFPAVELPLSISSDTEKLISEAHEPLNAAWMYEFVLEYGEELDEFTEFMPCFCLAQSEKFLGLVYWQASLEGSAYFLATFSPAGHIIDHKILAGTLYLEDGIKQMVCTVAKDWSIQRVEGQIDAQGQLLKENTTESKRLQVTLDGEILEDV